ncbi:tenascin-like [Patiria miniata]|uniref:Uncharacterized protein n=1 Tax=Patiria miniata TaxID=46514 RepID=A0A914B0W3_PATMI|nr:tenascin-like [Patiria miniata]
MRFLTHMFLAIIAILLVCESSVAVYLAGRPSAQTSNYKEYTPAYKGVDDTPGSCAITKASVHPWWRVNMMEEYCVGTITVVNRADCCAERLIGATVRAGLSPSVTENTVCGSPVTAEQATPGAWLRFTCDPPVRARYLSVDIDLRGSGRLQFLAVCEVKVEESQAMECPGWAANATGFLDATCLTPTPLLDPNGDGGAFIGTYLGARDATASVSFGRMSNTGHNGAPSLPASAHQVPHPMGSTDADLLYLPATGGLVRIGAFFCLATKDETRTQITMIILNKNDVHVRPVVLTKTVSLMESVTLEMEAVNPPNSDWRWRHDGGPFIGRSQDRLTHFIPSVCPRDAGIYECHVNTFRPLQRHAIMQLIVRACPSGRWGPDVSCTNICPPCYNGGVCDALSGRCVCAPGFKGRYCEEVLGLNFFGQDGSHYCQGSDDGNGCQGKLFCLPDPYGCSCAAGFKGFDCMHECDEGTYGADCKQTCHCALNVTCEKDTGKCLGACAPSYFGVNCQQTDCANGFFGAKCDQTCHCQGVTCHRDTGECEGPCAAPYFGINCQETGFGGVPNLVSYPSESTPGHVILSWGKDSASVYTIGYELVNRGHCEPITSPDRKFLPDRFDKETSHAILTDLEPSSVYRVYVQSHYGIHSIVPTESFVEVSTSPANDSRSVKDFRALDITSNGFLLNWSPVQCADAYYLTSDLLQMGHCSRSDTQQERSTFLTQSTSVTINCREPFATYSVSIVASVEGVNGSASTLEVATTKAAPGTPDGLTVVSSATNSLHFAWDDLPCEEHHGQFEGYRYALRDVSTGDTVASGIESVSEVGFTDLTPCRQYEFRVAALASDLQGSYSNWLSAQTAVQGPGSVNNLIVRDTSSSATTVSWQPPLLNTCGISEYRLRYVLTIQDMCSMTALTASPLVPVSTTSTSTRLTGLVPASQYQAFIKAINAADEGQEASVLWTTNESVPTNPPEDVMILAISANRSTGFSWSQPSCGGRGGVITKYAYRLSHQDGELVIIDSADETSREWVVFAGLEQFREYGFRVAATTSAGVGPYSQIIRATVNPGKDANLYSTTAPGISSAERKATAKSPRKSTDGDPVRPLPPAKSLGSAADISGTVVAVVVMGLLLIAVVVVAYVKLKRGGGSFTMFRRRVGWSGFANDEAEMMTEMDSKGQ